MRMRGCFGLAFGILLYALVPVWAGVPGLGNNDLEIDAPVLERDAATGFTVASQGVHVKYRIGQPDAAELTANRARVNLDTGEAIAEGNVILRREGMTWKSEQLEYNFKKQTIKSAAFRGGGVRYFMKGQGLTGTQTNGVYQARNMLFTTDDVPDPDFFLKAKRARVVEGDKVEMWHVVPHIGPIPFFYLPYYERHLGRHPWNIHLEPGYRSYWGAYLLSSTRWPGSRIAGIPDTWQTGEMHLDYRMNRGFGFGPSFDYQLGRLGKGHLGLYRAEDDDPHLDSRNIAIPRGRDRVTMQHRWGSSTNYTGIASLNYESDEYMRRDFFENEYRDNVQPSTFIELGRYWSDYELNLLAQPRLNDFYETVERLPDLRLSGIRHRVGSSPFYYDTESSLSHLRRNFAYNTQDDYGVMRADSLHQIFLPTQHFGWLNFTPRVGGRLTHYEAAEGRGSSQPARDRFLFNTGAELSTKASRLYPDAHSSMFQVDGLRHIVQPSLNYVFVPKPNNTPGDIAAFDSEIANQKLLPIRFPDYNAIDQVDSQNVMRLGLRNRLQTRREDQVEDFLDWGLYTDWRINPRSDQYTFADLFSDLDFRPRDWIGLHSETRYDIDMSLWRLINNSISFDPHTDWRLSLGQYYYLEDPKVDKADRSSVLYTGLGYRLSEDWSFQMNHYYDAKRGMLSDHTYILYRDMRSWVFSIELRMLDNAGSRQDDFEISLNYSLKSFPRAGR